MSEKLNRVTRKIHKSFYEAKIKMVFLLTLGDSVHIKIDSTCTEKE